MENGSSAKMKRRMAQIEEGVARYLHQLDSADRQERSLARTMKTTRLKEKIERLKQEMRCLEALDAKRAHELRPDGVREQRLALRRIQPVVEKVEVHHRRARGAQGIDRAVERRQHRRLDPVEEEACEPAEDQALEVGAGGWRGRGG